MKTGVSMTFKDWWTNENNPSLPKSQYMWSARHIIMLIIAIGAAVAFSIIFYKKSERAKIILLKVFAYILLFFELLSRLVNLIIETDFSFRRIFEIIMPLHICSVAVWCLIIGILFVRKKFLLNFTCIVGLLATVAFLLFPAVGINRTYISYTCLYSISAHTIGFVCAILLMTLGFVKFRFKEIWQVLVCFAAMFLWGVIVDFLILPGADYMYLRNDPLELNLSFPYHILYLIIILAYISLFYLVPLIKNKILDFKHKKAENLQENNKNDTKNAENE